MTSSFFRPLDHATRTLGTLSSPTNLEGSDPVSRMAPLSGSEPGLDISAKIAIGVCVPVTVLIVSAVAFYFWRQRRHKSKAGPEEGSSSKKSFGAKHELDGNEIPVSAEKKTQHSELDTNREIREVGEARDMDVKKSTVIAELPGNYTPAELPAGQDGHSGPDQERDNR